MAQKWEYKIVVANGEPEPFTEEHLNGMGQEGWELVSAMIHIREIPFGFSRVDSKKVLVFKKLMIPA